MRCSSFPVSPLIAFTIAIGCSESRAGSAAGEKPDKLPSESGIVHPKVPSVSDDEFEEKYLKIRDEIDQGGSISSDKPGEGRLAKVEAQLRQIAEQAEDAHLRANASVLLGSVFEERKDWRSAISFYRQATMFVPQEASTHAVLALAYAANKDFKSAQEVQKRVTELAPDDLQGWLLLGEISLKAGMKEQSIEAYAGYEMRRKGLLEGLTGKSEGAYKISAKERLECAKALVVARDNGTALGLLYALQSEPEANVRIELVQVMGEQRLLGYVSGLEQQAKVESDSKVKERIDWALAEIRRDPVDTTPAVHAPTQEREKPNPQIQKNQGPKVDPMANPPREAQKNQSSSEPKTTQDAGASSSTGAPSPK